VATPRVLDVLAERGLKATFFVVGERLQAYRALADRARREGHRIGNHTLTHPRPLGAMGAAASEEIEAAQALLGDLASPEKLFRPSGVDGDLEPGLLNHAAVGTLLGGGYTCVLWNAVPRDWEDADGWVDRALRQIEEQDWTLLVLHDVEGAAAARLEELLDRAADADVSFRQDFPPGCVPIRRGELVGDLRGLMAGAAGMSSTTSASTAKMWGRRRRSLSARGPQHA
jgi:peptidoglycan/xylan/chitin deacetylase (PgdA/CDA1 family)